LIPRLSKEAREERMVRQMSISETRRRITSLEDELSVEDTISITNHGKEVFALLRWESYESIAETLELLSDADAYADLKEGIRQLEAGELVGLEEFLAGLDV
jgi:PHD/YefM family antitoxin component YafN of YafNO toxin-antitoxin module